MKVHHLQVKFQCVNLPTQYLLLQYPLWLKTWCLTNWPYKFLTLQTIPLATKEKKNLILNHRKCVAFCYETWGLPWGPLQWGYEHKRGREQSTYRVNSGSGTKPHTVWSPYSDTSLLMSYIWTWKRLALSTHSQILICSSCIKAAGTGVVVAIGLDLQTTLPVNHMTVYNHLCRT